MFGAHSSATKTRVTNQRVLTLRGVMVCSDKAGTSVVSLRSRFVIMGGRSCLKHYTTFKSVQVATHSLTSPLWLAGSYCKLDKTKVFVHLCYLLMNIWQFYKSQRKVGNHVHQSLGQCLALGTCTAKPEHQRKHEQLLTAWKTPGSRRPSPVVPCLALGTRTTQP